MTEIGAPNDANVVPLEEDHVVIIFDECHRSQFGENHRAIREFFPNAQLFGFTGTPIFEKNANYKQVEGQQGSYQTTRDIFEQQLHAYTITDAIEDRIFEPFFTTKGVGKGTGMGLDITRRIIETRHRGTLRLHSEPGRTCFTVRLPL